MIDSTQLVPAVLVNGGLALFFWGIVWKNHCRVVDRLQDRVEGKVDRAWCDLAGREVKEDLIEIKNAQKKMAAAIEEIRVKIACRNGYREARKRVKEENKNVSAP